MLTMYVRSVVRNEGNTRVTYLLSKAGNIVKWRGKRWSEGSIESSNKFYLHFGLYWMMEFVSMMFGIIFYFF